MKTRLFLLAIGGTLFVRLIVACSSSDSTPGAGNPDGGIPDRAAPTPPPPPPPDATDAPDGGPTATRGDYLVNHLLLCTSCHAQPVDGGAPFAGGRPFPITVDGGDGGAVYAANLTPSPEGLGTWTTEQIAKAIREGIDDEGKPLHPTMPYAIYGNLTADDATSIALYLKTLAPSANVVPDRTAVVAATAPRLDDTKVAHTTAPSSDPSFASAERGRYLADVGCIDCHTTRLPTGTPDLTKAFAGGRAFGPTRKSSNLTPDPTGLGTWTTVQIADTLKTGQRQGTGPEICSPMPSGPTTFGGLSEGDLGDLATYLHTVAPIANGPFESDGGVCN